VRESAESAKPLLLGLARNRRSPRRPSEPRPSFATFYYNFLTFQRLTKRIFSLRWNDEEII
jgi:hypothetical protein